MIQSFQQGAAALARSSVYAATKFSQKSAGAVGHQRLSNQNLLPSARAQFLASAHLGYTASMFSPSRHSLLASRLQPTSSLPVNRRFATAADNQGAPQPKQPPVQRFLNTTEVKTLLTKNPALSELLSKLSTGQDQPTLEEAAMMLQDPRIDADAFSDLRDTAADTGYKRNTIMKNSGVGIQFELTMLEWQPGQETLVHDHSGSSCAFKVLQGRISETVYEKVSQDQARPTLTRHLETGSVNASESKVIHSLKNDASVNLGENVRCLHLYIPPTKGNKMYNLRD